MNTDSKFGMKCKNCKSTFGVVINMGSEQNSNCPKCGGELEADISAKEAIANYTCPNCESGIGLGIRIEKCPSCGQKI